MTTGKRRPVALVTGARRGIGRGIAFALADSGFDLALVDLEEDAAARETSAGVAARGATSRWLVADIADLLGHARLLDGAWKEFGTVDCLVNNAGVTSKKRADLLEATVDSYDRVMGVNLRGTFFLTQAAAKRMLAEPRDAGDPHRSIVTISSANATLPAPERPDYCMSKTALSMMAKMFALRLAPHGIGVYEIRPGIIRTDMTAPVATKYDGWIADGVVPERRWGEPADIGRAVATLASGGMPFSTGGAFEVGGGFHLRGV